MRARKLEPPATKPGYVVIEAIDSADGGMCLAVNNYRVSGCEPSLAPNNIVYRWNVREETLKQAAKLSDDASMTPARLCPMISPEAGIVGQRGELLGSGGGGSSASGRHHGGE